MKHSQTTIQTNSPGYLQAEKRFLDETEIWINQVELNFSKYLTREQLETFYSLHVERIKKEGLDPAPHDFYIQNAHIWIQRFIELFRESNKIIRDKESNISWEEEKRAMNEKNKIYKLYLEIIALAGEGMDANISEKGDNPIESLKDRVERAMEQYS